MQNSAYREFHCPKCGAPGCVTYGHTTYTCMCRTSASFPTYSPKFSAEIDGCRPITPITEVDVRKIVREELERLGVGKTEEQK
jgi:hypothetical protein